MTRNVLHSANTPKKQIFWFLKSRTWLTIYSTDFTNLTTCTEKQWNTNLVINMSHPVTMTLKVKQDHPSMVLPSMITQCLDDIAQCVQRFVDIGPFSKSTLVVRMAVWICSLTETSWEMILPKVLSVSQFFYMYVSCIRRQVKTQENEHLCVSEERQWGEREVRR